MRILIPSVALLAACCVCMPVSGLTVTGGFVDTDTTALSGKLGSSSGTIEDDPAATSVTAGVVSGSSASAVAGPVGAGALSTLPGTTGIATASASGVVDATTPGVIGFDLSASNSFTDLDGGTYQGFASAIADIEFTVSAPVDYTFVGTFNVDPGDITWEIQLKNGLGGFLLNNATETDDSGNILISGTLQPGFTYILEGQVSVADTLSTTGTGIANTSTFSTTLIVPEPSTLGLYACAAALLVRRRRAG